MKFHEWFLGFSVVFFRLGNASTCPKLSLLSRRPVHVCLCVCVSLCLCVCLFVLRVCHNSFMVYFARMMDLNTREKYQQNNKQAITGSPFLSLSSFQPKKCAPKGLSAPKQDLPLVL